MNENFSEKLFESYIGTLENGCSKHLNNDDIYVFGYYIDEFLTDAIAFLYDDSLDNLLENELINECTYEKSKKLRELSIVVCENAELKTVKGVRESGIWAKIIKLADELLKDIEQNN